MKKTFLTIAICSAVLAVTGSASADYYVTPTGDNVYQVYNSKTGTVVLVRNPESYIKFKKSQGKVEGFGGSISNTKFAKTSSVPEKTVKAAGAVVGTAANTAYQAVNLSPQFKQYAIPARILGKK